ncbi:TLD domain-containing protein 1 [Liparis tanakae]|uniref:MTOR-associated protein MEAK7 n=1 Tax=Liparis tanakae TaxID=230148 RepID=A0A4Z2ET28_9TELE|nr:TLD domain-containing protein 1 [Liparis tanakae]
MLVAEGLGVALIGRPAPPLLPPCGEETPWGAVRSLLDIPTLMFLTAQLPDGSGAPWRLVFSTQLHGESFTRMLGGLTGCGPTLLLLKDTRGHVFGGFASHAWDLKPQFQGFSLMGEEGRGQRSVLDANPELQAMLEMSGKTLHSQGLREPQEDQDQ